MRGAMSSAPADFEYEHKFRMGQRVLYDRHVWTVVGVQMSRTLVMWYTLERVLAGGGNIATRCRAYEDELTDPNP